MRIRDDRAVRGGRTIRDDRASGRRAGASRVGRFTLSGRAADADSNWMLTAVRQFARTALQTRSVLAAWRLCVRSRGQASVRLPGYPGPFRIRCGTSDAQFVRMLAEGRLPREYVIPRGFSPRVIFDIGANIGAVSAAFLQRWPAARLFAFEPLPENAALLRENLAAYSNATVLAYGLGARTAALTYERSDNPRNFGGGGFFGDKADPAHLVERVPVVAVGESLEQLGVDRIDLIKIDTEGAEHAILTSVPPDVVSRVQMIVGELHGKSDDDALVEYLGQWFDVAFVSAGAGPVGFRATRRRASIPPGELASQLAMSTT